MSMSDSLPPAPRVTLNPAPASAAPAAPTVRGATVVTDALGRKLTLRTLNVLDQVRLLRAIGPAQSSNEPYVNLVTMAAGVADIDGDPIPFPTNERAIDTIIRMVGDAGFGVLMAEMQRQIDEVHAAAEAAAGGAGRDPVDPLAKSA
jgi:hypothetical protein